MAIEEFWKNVWRTANRVGLRIESFPETDREETEANLRGASYWLKPGGVRGYDPAEFYFLSEAERSLLEDGVKQFRRASESVLGRAIATTEQYEEGEAGFWKILDVINLEKYLDVNAFVIGKKIENLVRSELPGWVKGLTFKTDYDSIGEPALRISVVAEDAALDDAILGENTRVVQDLFAEATFEVCPERFPYFHFRTVSEHERANQVDQG